MFKLLSQRGALAFLLAGFMNAFVDLGHKIIIQNTVFKIYDGSQQVILTAIVNALILLPFIMFFAPAGFGSDKYPKDKVMRWSAWIAVGLTLAITLCYYQGWFWPAFVMTFLLAIQATFYSPAKYGYIQALFGKSHLAEANGAVQAVSIIAILAGTVAFTVVFELWFPAGTETSGPILQSLAPAGWMLVGCTVLELALLYRLPTLEHPEPMPAFDWKNSLHIKQFHQELQPVLERDVIRLSVLGLSLFWAVGQVLLAAFPAFAKETAGIENTLVLQGVLACTGLGIALGSWLAARFSRNYIATSLIPVGIVGVATGLVMLPQFTSTTLYALDFLLIGTAGGMFIVPLNALIQFHSREDELGKVIAGNNLFQNIAMLSFLVLTVVVAELGYDGKHLLYLMAVVTVLGCVYTISKMPQSLLRFIAQGLLSQRYKVDIQGIQNIPSTGGVLLLGNHISWIDWAIVQIASPRPVRFVIIKSIYEHKYLKWLFRLYGCIPIANTGSRRALETISELLNQGEVVCLFPEGSISRNGHLGEFRRGFELACRRVNDDVVIVPFYLRGLWGSQFSRSSNKLKTLRRSGYYREIIVAFGQPQSKTSNATFVKQRVFELSVQSWQRHVENLPTLTNAWISSVKKAERRRLSLADGISKPLTADKALTAAWALSHRIRQISPEQNIGVLLPTSTGGVLCNMATLLAGKTIVNLNYTASKNALIAAIEQADIQTIYTSRRFIERLVKRNPDAVSVLEGRYIIYLEDLRSQIHFNETFWRWLAIRMLPARILKHLCNHSHDSQQTAAILFSSGSEGSPKGVMLSHQNIMANLKQISDVVNTQEQDVLMSCLPLFHAFGLTVNQFMPLIEGIPVVCHVDPTDAVGVAKNVAQYRATILCGTSTFFRLYAKHPKVHPLMMESLRIVVAGAEKLNPAVREAFLSRFNKHILEGYGATETTPVASVNLPDCLDTQYWDLQIGSKTGSVGMPLPGSSVRIVDPETFEQLPTGSDGMILIGGPQVMQGYLNNPEKTASVIKEIDDSRWYVTGDKGHLDEDGFLFIVDRYSRFAKIGGEMISLTTVEQAVQKALPEETEVIAVNLPDEKKGEQIVLLTTASLDPDHLRKTMLAQGCPPLLLPSRILQLTHLPKLGSGKTDFSLARQVALQTQEQDPAE
ncbi:MAG: acyl-[ACP]--phospholipid O-acyltransferase [Tolumonas sp.]